MRVFHVPAPPTGLAAGGGRVWVAMPSAGAVWVLDASGRRVGEPIATGGTPARLALDARSVWIADTDRSAVVRVPRAGGQAASPVQAGPDVTDVAVAGGRVWTASSADGAVRRVEGGRATVVAHGIRPLALAADGGRVVAADASAAALLRVQPAQPRVPLGGTPVDVALAGGEAWVADAASGAIERVDLATGRVQRFGLGHSPVAIAADARDVYVLCQDDRTLVRVDPRSGSVRERLTLPDAPAAIALDPAHVWIAAGNRDVIRVDR
jgi:DNA-binding beta-propeller fold protein YncE